MLNRRSGQIDAAVIGEMTWLVRYFGEEEDRGLLVDLGHNLPLTPRGSRLLAPLAGQAWWILWSSEAPDYGGPGTPALYRRRLRLPGNAALVLGAGVGRGSKRWLT